MAKNYQTQFSYDHKKMRREVNNKPSLTVPDQSLSVKQILDRYARGLPLGGMKVPVYDGEEDVPDFNKLDLAERQELLEQTKQSITNIKASLLKDQEEKRIKRAAHKKAAEEHKQQKGSDQAKNEGEAKQ